MNLKKVEAVKKELKLIAKELYAAEEKKEFKDLDYRGRDLPSGTPERRQDFLRSQE